jgi:nitroreductase
MTSSDRSRGPGAPENCDMSTLLEQHPDVLHTIYQRRAVRTYAAGRPSDSTLRELLDAAVQAPTAMHGEPWAFIVVQDKRLLERLSDRAKTILLADIERGGGLAPDATVSNHMRTMLGNPSYNIFYDAGTLVVICRKHRGPFTEADCWLAAENLMLAACAKDLGTCCIGFAVPVLNAPDVKQDLGIPQDGDAVVPINVGIPRGPVEHVIRRPPQVLRWLK